MHLTRLRPRQIARDVGAVMVEFAIVLTLMVTLVAGVIEFGRAYNTTLSLQGGAREGARALALLGVVTCGPLKNKDDPCVSVQSAVNGSMPVVGADISPNACTSSGGTATVKVSKNFFFLFPLLPSDLRTITLSGSASMRCGL